MKIKDSLLMCIPTRFWWVKIGWVTVMYAHCDNYAVQAVGYCGSGRRQLSY